MSKRGEGRGTITKLADGRFWVRAPRQPNGQRPSLGIYATEEEANRVLEIGRRELANSVVDSGQAFLPFARTIMVQREKSGAVRSWEQENALLDTHIATAHFAGMSMHAITPFDIARWLREMSAKRALIGRRNAKPTKTDRLLAESSITRVFTLLRSIFQEACPPQRSIVDRNPCDGLKVQKRADKRATKDKEVFLSLDEQRAIRDCECIPEFERYFILFAFGCGVRRGEQFNLELNDVRVVYEWLPGVGPRLSADATIRFGSDGKPQKNGNIDTIPVFGFAFEALVWQLERLARRDVPNPLGILWPTELGNRRRGKPLGNGHFRESPSGTHVYRKQGKNPVRAPKGKGTHVYVDRLKEALALAGISRHVRWHDLRHTCASALLQGQWGDAWTLAEVKDQLRHASVTTTERYAHLGETALKNAAKKVHVGYALVTGAREGDPGVAAIRNDINEVEPRGIEPLTSSMPSKSILELLRALAEENAADNPHVTNLANALSDKLGQVRT